MVLPCHGTSCTILAKCTLRSLHSHLFSTGLCLLVVRPFRRLCCTCGFAVLIACMVLPGAGAGHGMAIDQGAHIGVAVAKQDLYKHLKVLWYIVSLLSIIWMSALVHICQIFVLFDMLGRSSVLPGLDSLDAGQVGMGSNIVL